MVDIISKPCRKCGVDKPVSKFWKDKSRRDGLQTKCIDCWLAFWKSKTRKERPPQEIVTVTSLGFTWNKYGGTSYGVLQKDLTPQWYCQACNEPQTEDLPPYMFEYPEREYIRICSKCQFERTTKNIDSFFELIQIVRVQIDG